MNPLFGVTRTAVEFNHALIGPDGHVISPLAGWTDAEGVVLISPALRGGVGGPRFSQYLVHGSSACRTTGAAAGVERLVYVLAGQASLDGELLQADDFAWFPPGDAYELTVGEEARLLVFEKAYEPLAGTSVPSRQRGSHANSPSEPFMGDEDAMLATLLPIESGFDMAVNVFSFQPGTTLPLVETHVMEHGLYMRSGQGIYRLGEKWYPVQQGDTIWMASYCPQWFVAMGKQTASYVYYKDIHRDPLAIPQGEGN
ncbi:MAG: (S)-ureidoglycine aminohydrolase [Planctomycetota bacterium]